MQPSKVTGYAQVNPGIGFSVILVVLFKDDGLYLKYLKGPCGLKNISSSKLKSLSA